jgi:hypothetical protein
MAHRFASAATEQAHADGSGVAAAAAAAMLHALMGSYLMAVSPLPLLPPAAAAGGPSPSARPRGRLMAVLRLVPRRCAEPRESVRAASAVEEEDDEGEAEVVDEGLPSWEGSNGEEDYDHDHEIGDIMGDYFDDPKKAQTRVRAPCLIFSSPLMKE